MHRKRSGIGLGQELRRARKTARLTQSELASKVGLTERTIRHLEQGEGMLASFEATLVPLALEIAGRNLPPGEQLGERIRCLRRRRKLTQHELAEAMQVLVATIRKLENSSQGRLSTVEAACDVLGAGLYLAPKDKAKAFFTHAGNSSTDQGWETPLELLNALYQVFPRFDLDPCAPRQSRPTVKARVRFTAEDDGLSLPWHGAVFLNPPYGRTLACWIAKARREVEEGRAKTVVALLPARPDTRYWHEHIAGKAAVYFLRGRLRFSNSEQSAPFPSALAVWGASLKTLQDLDAALPEAWRAR